ncbi:GntR family transcriptional regulator [Brachybacterium sp. JHP9]|uniref:GntR family transcriptional regulator n=1 Tax=Brachybacterium equifaecis TaxID=2910770 RepID=A0ABT0R3F4_9MICO|nr:GntR family transcriptional regulator [Brachybacterium equifaecis]MCL6424469.1 GntR family transcriptional regulator [Brachybacterium equifaecis]
MRTVLHGIVRIDRTSLDSPAQQIHTSIARAIQDGRLAPGTRLPTVRALAAEAGVAVNTVAKAFRRLGEAQLVITRGRAGTVVAPLDTVGSRLESAARAYAELAAEHGFGAEASAQMVLDAFADLRADSAAAPAR